MKKLLFAALSLIACNAMAEEALITPGGWHKPGEPLDLKDHGVYYLNRKCELPLANAKDMRKYVFYRGAQDPADTGCWGVTIDNMVFTVVPQVQTANVHIAALKRADVRADWTAVLQDQRR